MNKDNKKKICVISAYAYIVHNVNYGSLLQYYALQEALKSQGHSPFWLRFILPAEESLIYRIKLVAKYCLAPGRAHKRNKILNKFREFISNYLEVSDKIYDNEDVLKEDCPQADVYITGSDQVWGGTLKPNYLCFAPLDAKKISYAASFGKSHLSDYQFNIIAPWVQKLDAVSVREKSGVEICKRMGVSAQLVLDPTLLLCKEQYPAKKGYYEKYGEYVFAYFLNLQNKDDLPIQTIQDYVASQNSKFIVAGGMHGIEKVFSKNIIEYYSPEEWLGMYSEAQGIMTNTFHGTVFAIIFQCPFIVFLQNGKTKKQNERLYSLLEYFNLESRIYDSSELLEEQMNRKINWNEVEKKHKKGSYESYQFLQNQLSN